MRSKLFLVVPALALFAATGCQVVAGVESRSVDPIKTDCALPTTGDATIRIANLVPSTAAIDVCVRPTGGTYKRPVLRDAGTQCPAGLAFKDVSAPFAMPSGSVDIKIVASGTTCKDAALAEATEISLPSGSATTLAHLKTPDGTSSQVIALPESNTAPTVNAYIRFVNAVVGSKPLTLGFAAKPTLPTTVSAALFPTPVPYGAVSSSAGVTLAADQPLSVDANGYLLSPPNDLTIGASESGSDKAVLATVFARANTRRTIFAVGDDGNTSSFPPRGLICDETAVDGVKTKCVETQLSSVSVDMFNAGLYGGYAPDEAKRRPYVIPAIAARKSDFMCITDVATAKDRAAIVAAAMNAGWVDSVTFDSDLNTPFTDPRALDGTTPDLPTTPSCGDDTREAENAVYDCLSTNCKDPATGGLTTGACYASACAGPIASGFFNKGKAAARCINCITGSAVSYTPFTQAKTACDTDVRNQFAFQGQTPSLLLSRYPIKAKDHYVVASSAYRRTVLRAQVDLSAGTSIDVYCAQLGTNLHALQPYPGPYDLPDTANWDGEQQTQAQRITDWIKAQSGTRPAIILSDLAASAAASSDGTQVVDDDNPKVVEKFRSSFEQAVPPGYVPHCTRCPKAMNPYNDLGSYWSLQVFTLNLGKNPSPAAGIFMNEGVDALGGKPVSVYYGFNAEVLRPD